MPIGSRMHRILYKIIDFLTSILPGDNAIFQKIKNSQWELKNYFNQLYTKEKYTWGIRLYPKLLISMFLQTKNFHECTGLQYYLHNSLQHSDNRFLNGHADW